MLASCTLNKRLDLDVRVVAILAAMSFKQGWCETCWATQSSTGDTTTGILDGLRCLLPNLHQHLGPHILIQNDRKFALRDVKLCHLLVMLAQPGSAGAEHQQCDGKDPLGKHSCFRFCY